MVDSTLLSLSQSKQSGRELHEDWADLPKGEGPEVHLDLFESTT